MNYLRLILIVALLGLVAVEAIADEYEYYRGAQFPGKGLREDVELRTVVSEGGRPTEYQRREVKFFPRKGVDEIPVVDDAGKPVGLIDVQDLLAPSITAPSP